MKICDVLKTATDSTNKLSQTIKEKNGMVAGKIAKTIYDGKPARAGSNISTQVASRNMATPMSAVLTMTTRTDSVEISRDKPKEGKPTTTKGIKEKPSVSKASLSSFDGYA